MLTAEEIVKYINETVTTPIPILVTDEDAPKVKTENGDLPMMAMYTPEKRIIVLYTKSLPFMVEDLLNLIRVYNIPTPPNQELNPKKVAVSYVIHELRHYDQHMWLIRKMGEKEGTKKFLELTTAAENYYTNILEIDAYMAQFQVFYNLDDIMEQAIA